MHTIVKVWSNRLERRLGYRLLLFAQLCPILQRFSYQINAMLVMEIISPGASIHHQYPKISADEK